MIDNAAISRRLQAAVGVVGLGIGGGWWLLDPGRLAPLQLTTVDLLLFVVAAAVMELVPIRQPGGRPLPTSLAVVGAAAVLGAAPPVVALIAGLGWALAAVANRGRPHLDALAARIVGGWTLAGLAAVGYHLGPPTWHGTVEPGTAAAAVNPGAAVAVALAVVVGIPLVSVVTREHLRWRFAVKRIGEAVVANGLVGVAVASTTVLGVVVHPVLGLWTLPTMLIPLLAARIGLDRYVVAARAYDQTIRAMSRLPERLGTVADGHGVRVATLSEAVALELGLDAAAVRDVVRAAHLHELGRIKLEREAPAARRDLALAGAAVIHEAASLDRVAAIVEVHGAPAEVAGHSDDVARAARVVAACCEIDRYAPAPGDAAQQHEVVVRLVRDVVDIEVVAAITRVLETRDRLAGVGD